MNCPIDKTAARNEGQRRKGNALTSLGACRGRLMIRARRALLMPLLAGITATIDEVREAIELPQGVDPTAFGAVPGPLARMGIIRRVGYVPTCRPGAHARPVTVWALADRGKAEAWLVEHPEPLDDPEWPDDGLQGAIVANNPKPPPNKTGATAATVAPDDPTDLEAQRRGEP